ncbi:hypothetical protein [Sedimentibacter sp.]|uniref:hypothetical protein n=1 Tax=Sedimentibacter sp. TaxID=1960295 RepID=UPI002898CB92|nr:hypothetical protein [Sedimentibacter sp.]
MLRKIKKTINAKKVALSTVALAAATNVQAFASEPTLTFNFDPAEMFSWTNVMLSALMPVLYITLGISLAFIIINALKYAFR